MTRTRRDTILALTSVLALVGPAHASAAARSCPEVGFVLIEPVASAATRPVEGPGGGTLHVRREAITTTADVTDVALGGDGVDGRLLLKFKPEADARLGAATAGRPGLRIAFVADDEALLAVTWGGDYGVAPGGVSISMENGQAKARRLVEALRPCVPRGP